MVMRLVFTASLISIDRAGDRKILVLRFAASGDLVVGHDKLAFLVVFVSGDAVMDGPLACEVWGCECKRSKQQRRYCEKSLHLINLSNSIWQALYGGLARDEAATAAPFLTRN